MLEKEPFIICNWNIGGAKFLELKESERKEHRDKLHSELKELINRKGWKPHVITLQEVVRFGTSPGEHLDLLSEDEFKDYDIYVFPLLDSTRLSSHAKWDKVKNLGGWSENAYFAQGNAMLFRKDMPHSPVWDLSAAAATDNSRHFIEQVNLESGLYFGDRDTEPRAALVAHFILNAPGHGRPLDLFVVSVHLTTLTMEREGIPEIDTLATRIRLAQLEVIFTGIVSRYNSWKQRGYPVRGERRKLKPGETFDRYPPIWILTGDFNFTPESVEYQAIERVNFMDMVPHKSTGTKASGIGKDATLTLDYVFAGPKFISLDPLITVAGIDKNRVNHNITVSDHYPMVAKVPLAMEALGA